MEVKKANENKADYYFVASSSCLQNNGYGPWAKVDFQKLIYDPIFAEKASIELNGIEGEIIINTKDWYTGIYYFKAVLQCRTIQTGKIVIGR